MAPLHIPEAHADRHTLPRILDDYAAMALRSYGVGLAGAFGAGSLIKRPYDSIDLVHGIGWVGIFGLLGLSLYLSGRAFFRTAGEIWAWREESLFRGVAAVVLIGLLFVATGAVGFYAHDLVRQTLKPVNAQASLGQSEQQGN